MPKVQVEVSDKGRGLDEVVLRVRGKCLFHLEQLDDQHWRMSIGDPEGQYVRVVLFTPRVYIGGTWEDEGPVEVMLLKGEEA